MKLHAALPPETTLSKDWLEAKLEVEQALVRAWRPGPNVGLIESKAKVFDSNIFIEIFCSVSRIWLNLHWGQKGLCLGWILNNRGFSLIQAWLSWGLSNLCSFHLQANQSTPGNKKKEQKQQNQTKTWKWRCQKINKNCFWTENVVLKGSNVWAKPSFYLNIIPPFPFFLKSKKKLVSIKNVLLYRRMIIRHSDAGSSFSSPSSDEESISYLPDSIRLIKTDLLTPISSINSRTLI